MQFGPIDHIILFGGGSRLIACLDLARARSFRTEVISAPRLLSAALDGTSTTVADALRARGVPFQDVVDLTQYALHERVTPTTLGISFGAPWIFRRAQIDCFRGRLLNAHGTCLPENRGAATFTWQILRGDHRGACLLHAIDGGVDTGPILMMEPYTLPVECRTPEEYRAYYLAHEPAFLARFLDRVFANDVFVLTPQDEERSTYFPRLATTRHAFIDWSWNATEIARFIAAFDRPYDGAMTFHRGARVVLRDADATARDGAFHPFMRGLVIRKTGDAVAIAVVDGTVLVRTVCDASGGEYRAQVRPGHRFITPQAVLEDALAFEAVYDARGLRADRPRASTTVLPVWLPDHSSSTSAP